jgi:hypothetical protein
MTEISALEATARTKSSPPCLSRQRGRCGVLKTMNGFCLEWVIDRAADGDCWLSHRSKDHQLFCEQG